MGINVPCISCDVISFNGQGQQRGEVRRHGTTVALISGGQQNQRRRRRQGERQKKMVILTSSNFARESRYFFAIVAPLRHEISLFHAPAVWSRLKQHKNCRFLYLNLDNDRYGPKENFAKICQIK